MTTTTTQKHTLPADVFDALELTALIFGGIGSACLFDDSEGHVQIEDAVPLCIIGHAMFLDGYAFAHDNDNEEIIRQYESPVTDALVAAFPELVIERGYDPRAYHAYRDTVCFIESRNDSIVDELTNPDKPRITWKQWCKQLRVVRGDS